MLTATVLLSWWFRISDVIVVSVSGFVSIYISGNFYFHVMLWKLKKYLSKRTTYMKVEKQRSFISCSHSTRKGKLCMIYLCLRLTQKAFVNNKRILGIKIFVWNFLFKVVFPRVHFIVNHYLKKMIEKCYLNLIDFIVKIVLILLECWSIFSILHWFIKVTLNICILLSPIFLVF